MADSEEREFPSPFDFNAFAPVTLVELRMRILSGAIRAKPLWWEKVNDPEIVAKWRAEIVEQDRAAVERFWGGAERLQDTLHTDEDGWVPKQWPRDPINDAQLDYIFEELKWAASRRDEATGIFVGFDWPAGASFRELILKSRKPPFTECMSRARSSPRNSQSS